MRISQVGVPSVCLSSNVDCRGDREEAEFIAVHVPVKIEERADEDGPVVAQVQFRRGAPLEGQTVEKRSSAGWLLFRIPRRLCPEGGSLTLCALVDQVVLWEEDYQVVWHGRFPRLEPAV